MAFRVGKFKVIHDRRGEFAEDEAFVLVPGRDPAAVAALRAYATATADAALAGYVTAWLDRIEAGQPDPDAVAPRGNIPGFMTQLAVWTSTLSREVRENGMALETALQRIAGFAWTARKKLDAERAVRRERG